VCIWLDETKRKFLDWHKGFNIINDIARRYWDIPRSLFNWLDIDLLKNKIVIIIVIILFSLIIYLVIIL